MAKKNARILIYSHDSFGLGHLRRCREIAHSLVEKNSNISILILTGSPIIGSFDFKSRVDFVRIPGVIKSRNGEYTSLKLHIDISETIRLRESIIRHTALEFNPDIFIVDKEPLGLQGEVLETLKALQKRGTTNILGLRDVMDDPVLLNPEWQRKNVLPALERLYHHIWIYGLPQIHNPLEGLEINDMIANKVTYTGYIKRKTSQQYTPYHFNKIKPPYFLVTPGGGQDGWRLIDWVVRAYESKKTIPYPALIVLGPFMTNEHSKKLSDRVDKLENIEIVQFYSNMENLVNHSIGVVAMGGYNTCCEILSFDKPAILVPRTQPRLEQHIRASCFANLGMLKMLPGVGLAHVNDMVVALQELPKQNKPSNVIIPGLLDGLQTINTFTKRLLKS